MRRAAYVLAVAAGLVVVLILTLAAFGLPVGESLAYIWEGALGDKFGRARTLVRATPLVLCGLGIVVAWRARMFNIGGEGQYVLGGVCGAWAASFTGAPPGLQTFLILVSAGVGGALFAGLAGWLHVKRGVQVVISTILLNFVALQVLSYAVNGPLQEDSRMLPQTERLSEAVMFARFDPQSDLHAGVFIALAAAALLAIFLFLTKSGFRLRLAGENPEAARVAGVDVGRTQLGAMLLSGALCGLAGGVDYVGFIGHIGVGFPQNWGFLSIPVALLGALHPAGVLASGVFFGGLFAGSENLARYSTVGGTVVYVLQAVAMMAYVGFKAWSDNRKTVREAI